jgi:outer membrane protein
MDSISDWLAGDKMRNLLKAVCLGSLILSIIFILDIKSYSRGEGADIKIGFIHLQKALSLSLAGKRAAESLSKEREKLLERIKGMEDELALIQERLSKQAALFTEETLKQKQNDFRDKMKSYERFRSDSVQDWERKKKELESKILSEVVRVVQELGKEKEYTVIFAGEQGILYASDAIDLTDETIAKYDAESE